MYTIQNNLKLEFYRCLALNLNSHFYIDTGFARIYLIIILLLLLLQRFCQAGILHSFFSSSYSKSYSFFCFIFPVTFHSFLFPFPIDTTIRFSCSFHHFLNAKFYFFCLFFHHALKSFFLIVVCLFVPAITL